MKFIEKEKIIEFLTPYAQQLGVEIVDVEASASKSPFLTVFIDKEGGVDLDALEKFHNLIDAPLDELDPYPQAYTLNVSSPGVDRPLKTERDFLRKIGKPVEVRLYKKINGLKNFEGTLKAFNCGEVTVTVNGKDLVFEQKDIAKICESVIF